MYSHSHIHKCIYTYIDVGGDGSGCVSVCVCARVCVRQKDTLKSGGLYMSHISGKPQAQGGQSALLNSTVSVDSRPTPVIQA